MNHEVGNPVGFDTHQVGLHQDLRRHLGIVGRHVQSLKCLVDEVHQAGGGESL